MGLLESGKIKQYLKYAIGEIFLVTIGILIALQINNWNENRKLNLSVEQALTEIENNLISDSLMLDRVVKNLGISINKELEILRAINNNKMLDSTYNESFGRIFNMHGGYITRTGFEKLKNIGLSNVNDADLEETLITFYEVYNNDLESEMDDDKKGFFEIWTPYFMKNFDDYTYRRFGVPKSYEELSADSEFKMIVKLSRLNHISTQSPLMEMKVVTRQLIKKIQKRKA